MKTQLVGTFLLSFLLTAAVAAKPPAKPAATPDNDHVNPTAAWLLEQNGGKDAITLPLGEVLHALTHQPILTFDRANPDDASFLAKLGGVMDRVLPRMNRPDSTAHAASRAAKIDEVAASFEEEIRATVRGTPDFTPQDAASARIPGRSYPSVHLVDAKSGKHYYLAVALYPEGKREDATRTASAGEAIQVLQGQAVRQIVAGGCCLLVGIEYRDAPGGNVAFLNWDVSDVANVPVHAAVTFQADAADVYGPGAVLTDGRKGSD